MKKRGKHDAVYEAPDETIFLSILSILKNQFVGRENRIFFFFYLHCINLEIYGLINGITAELLPIRRINFCDILMIY